MGALFIHNIADVLRSNPIYQRKGILKALYLKANIRVVICGVANGSTRLIRSISDVNHSEIGCQLCWCLLLVLTISLFARQFSGNTLIEWPPFFSMNLTISWMSRYYLTHSKLNSTNYRVKNEISALSLVCSRKKLLEANFCWILNA